ncbi:50S ribosomal protein L25 [bacterium (Candidatus Gribaldobacteria) CG_4_10_14_0_8_um_filter_33_9]|uniref:Large ribosomal subunit protein bL25 n=1 Tax=bacterium (Candidatus Gribaldobacteria) CG_4_10_14_0_8_um_filter_33_9 TaxID=2014266 RepID=A0A2M7RP96_9BACT|nr:MAG: 50S ribosomal protein L25 [bacterium (Candidatus Gribaldobacteria) CG_4_10_14_0_8_um_filter_33_9]
MLQIKTKIRDIFGRKTNSLRKKGILPAVLYGAEIGNFPLEISFKEFEKVFKEAGESSLIILDLDGKKYEVVIHDLAKDPLKGNISHVDFYHPSSIKEIITSVPLIFEGEEAVQKTSLGNLTKRFHFLEIKCLSKDLLKEIKVDLTVLKNIGDKIQIKDLQVSDKVKILKKLEETVAIIVSREEFKEEVKEVKEEKPNPDEKTKDIIS